MMDEELKTKTRDIKTENPIPPKHNERIPPIHTSKNTKKLTAYNAAEKPKNR